MSAITWGIIISASAPTQTASAAQQAQAAPTPQWMTGTWSDFEDCRRPVRFQRDGRFIAPGGAEGRWRMEGSTLILSAGDRTNPIPIERLDQNRARRTDNEIISYRCEGPNATRSR